MNDTVQIRAGGKENLPELLERTLGYCRDTEGLYIGTPEGNVLLASSPAAAGRFAALTITGDVPEAEAMPGMLFEDAGTLKYKNLAGVVLVVAAPPPDPDPEEGV